MAVWLTQELLSYAEPSEPGIKIQGVTLFMGANREKLGISFCELTGPKWLSISPGLAKLLNGNSFKTTMKKKHYEKLPEVIILNRPCRIVRVKDKTVLLLTSGSETAFSQACNILEKLAKDEYTNKLSRTISVDAMVLCRAKGVTVDRVGALKAVQYHEIIVYEDREENLSYMRLSQQDTLRKPADVWGNIIRELHIESGSERLKKNLYPSANNKPSVTDIVRVCPLSLKSSKARRDHFTNAFIEYKAIVIETIKKNQDICKDILQAYHWKSESLLKYRLENAKAALYNCYTSQIIGGKIDGEYITAYNEAKGFIHLEKDMMAQSGQLTYKAPSEDPIVVLAECTKCMVEDKILKTMESITGSLQLDATWILPHITWINGVAGCGKTTLLVEKFISDTDLIITTTDYSAEYLKARLMQRLGEKVDNKVRTMSSVLGDAFNETEQYRRLLIDKAMTHHFGSIVMAARLSGAEEIFLIGDVNQVTHESDFFITKYTKPGLLATVDKEILCTHRCPMDVAYALREIYPGIYSSSKVVRSFEMKLLTGSTIPYNQVNTLFLVYTKEEKDDLIKKGYGKGKGSKVLTICEAQALSFDTVIILRCNIEKKPIHNNIPLAVVAITRHTRRCVYYSDYYVNNEPIYYLIRKGEGASKTITEYNLQMAIRNKDFAFVDATVNAGR